MDIQEVKRFSDEILDAMTERDRTGKGYVCPVCGSGSGKNGTGLVPVKNRPGYYHCFNNGCNFHGDILELVGQAYHLQDAVEQVRKAGELIHRDFLGSENEDKKQWYNQKSKKKVSGKDNKNMVENKDTQTADKNEGLNQDNLRKEQAEIQAFIKAAAAALLTSENALQYLTWRGISKETAIKYNLGYVPHYGDGMNTQGIVIPTGRYSYTVRSMDTDDGSRKTRKKKAGDRAGIFGMGIMKTPPPVVFVVEGEFDKLSINEAGFNAICTGGGTSKKEIVEQIKARGNVDTTFYIIPDNDKLPDGSPDLNKGIKAGKDLLELMQTAGLKAELVDVLAADWPQRYKDCNDFLQDDRGGFIKFLEKRRYAVEEKELGRVSGYMQDFIQQMAGNTPPIATGFKKLDEILEDGLHPGLVIVGAISSLGKTTFCLNIADMLAMQGRDVLFYSLEMSKFELVSKIISRRTAIKCLQLGTDMKKAKTSLGVSDFKRWKNYYPEDRQFIKDRMSEFDEQASRHLSIREGMQTIGTAQIRQEIQKHQYYTGHSPVVIVDYIQILKSPDPHLTDKQKTDENVTELKRISRDYNTPIVGISSFNRDNYKEPVSMSAFKESGAIEYTSDVLIGLQFAGMDYQEDDTNEKARNKRIRELFKENEVRAMHGASIPIHCKILKNRSGGKGSCVFDYFPMFNLYVEG